MDGEVPALVVSAAVRRPVAATRPAVPPPAAHRQPPPAASPARFTDHLDVIQVVCWQIAVLTIVLTVGRPWPVQLSAISGALILAALTAVRIRGRWGYELAGVAFGFLLRTRRHRAPIPLELVLPGSAVRAVEIGPDVLPAISHPRGLTVMIGPRSLPGELTGRFPDPVALLPAAEEPAPELVVQTLFHSGAEAATPTELWLAVRAVRTVEAMLDEELALVLHNALRRIRRCLDRAGAPAGPLPEDEVLAAVTALAQLSGGHVREDWNFLRTGPMSQACFVLDGWDRLADRHARWLVPQVLDRTGRVAATLSLSARSPEGRSRAVLRLAARTEFAADGAASRVADLLAANGVGLTRLDGSQLAGLAATLPLGSFPT